MAWFEKLYDFILTMRSKAKAMGRSGQGADRGVDERRGLVVAHAAADPAFPQERA